jgi:hypothetical protein
MISNAIIGIVAHDEQAVYHITPFSGELQGTSVSVGGVVYSVSSSPWYPGV